MNILFRLGFDFDKNKMLQFTIVDVRRQSYAIIQNEK